MRNRDALVVGDKAIFLSPWNQSLDKTNKKTEQEQGYRRSK